jgi:hypothetical protein
MFQVGEWPWKLLICLLDVLKNDFCEVDETMIQGVERPLEIGFRIQDIEKSDFYDLA